MTSDEATQTLDSTLLAIQSEALTHGESATPLDRTRAWRLVRTHSVARHRLGDPSALTLTMIRLRLLSRVRWHVPITAKRDQSVRRAVAHLARELRARSTRETVAKADARTHRHNSTHQHYRRRERHMDDPKPLMPLDPTYVKKTLRTTYRDTHVVWGSSALRDALVMRDACRAIMAQAHGCEDAQKIIIQFRDVADAHFPGA